MEQKMDEQIEGSLEGERQRFKSLELFEKELAILINKYSIENECDMPDFILASMVSSYIIETGKSFKQCLDWHGCDSICHPRKRILSIDHSADVDVNPKEQS